MLKISLHFLLVSIIFSGCTNTKNKTKTLLFIGSFTDKKPGKGIHVYEFDEDSGKTSLTYFVDSITNTSFLKISSNGRFLYSVVDSQMKYNGKIAAFKVDILNSKIGLLNMQDSGGINPAHLELDKTGNYLVNSNYSDGSLSLFKIKKDGSLEKNRQVLQFKDSSIIKKRQEASHIHSSNFSPENEYIFAHDLGADKIRSFQFNISSEKLQSQQVIKTKLGSGPRHFVFHPNGKFGYGINELSGKINSYKYDNGNLVFIEDYLSYQHKQEIYRAADIHISADGNFLYASNRGPKEDSIVVFSINKNNGKLRFVGHTSTFGNHPRNFAISPTGKFLLVANQFSNTIVIFRRDFKTGKLTKLPNEISVNSPSSLQMKTYAVN